MSICLCEVQAKEVQCCNADEYKVLHLNEVLLGVCVCACVCVRVCVCACAQGGNI